MITHTRMKYHTSQALQHTQEGNIHTTNVNTVHTMSGNPWGILNIRQTGTIAHSPICISTPCIQLLGKSHY